MISWLLLLFAASERLPLPADGRFEAPPGKCVRVLVRQNTTIRVNGLYAGETASELDITGYLKSGVNEVRAGESAMLLFSPLVYLRSAESDGRTLRVAVVNTTENTMQVELDGSHQFTVSPGTTGLREVPATSSATARIRATSDGLDSVYEDEIPVVQTRARARSGSASGKGSSSGLALGNRLIAIAPTTDRMNTAFNAKP
jgi:hypothetical protein